MRNMNLNIRNTFALRTALPVSRRESGIMGIDALGYVVCVYIGATRLCPCGIGADNRAIIDPIDMFDMALAKQSKKVIIAHNHTYGTQTCLVKEKKLIQVKTILTFPTGRKATNKLYHACLPFGIEIIDHIIFADKIFYTYGAQSELC